ncbi:hypothetical protein D1AOALGA4SA_1319 [Olavius algarvensis Delta 1 endosymbiont]|nr:hypothetical protein D1AOALGA4SA_1319 [Olavius algarvensis Delta 1 endosymbiont]
MKLWLGIAIVVLTFTGCTFWGETREKTLSARQVTSENLFSFGSVSVIINPELPYTNISGDIKIEIMGKVSTPTKREFHLFTRPGIDNMVYIETHKRNYPHTFDQSKELTAKMIAIQKGRKPIDGETWDVYVRSHPQFPEQILSAARQKGVPLERYLCALEVGVARATNRYSRIYISYFKGVEDCGRLPRNGSVLSSDQVNMIRNFARQFEENITIDN